MRHRLLEQSRHQATELTNATRAEVEQTLEWARAQAGAILSRAQTGTEQLLAAAGLGEQEIKRVAESIVEAAKGSIEATRTQSAAARPAAAVLAPPPVSSEPAEEAEAPAAVEDESQDEKQP